MAEEACVIDNLNCHGKVHGIFILDLMEIHFRILNMRVI